ncbi:hypothetical protein EHQ79_05335 [Leptospira jelokensis]|uniref:Uncharacterized protein n=2 Tax=Leptospira jelokensis TaxID=2484931 RepID=A0A4Z0ZVP3_9LEPT|nr:hypothetical protein EHQ62_04455 [Leptospira jelokensis]TGM05575.1 hypothetical protein EHQ79_05335 [Leptospira jelokensis]
MDMLDQINLHMLMEDRLERILEDLEKRPKGKTKKIKTVNPLPANRERAEWNLQEIPVLYGA